MKFSIKINDIDYSQNATIPFNTQKTLDDSLDTAFIKLCYLEKAEAFKPLSNVVIFVKDNFGNTKNYYYFISSDIVSEIIAIGKYNHDIALIEQTKWLERFTGIVKTNTKPLIKDITEAQQYSNILKTVPGVQTTLLDTTMSVFAPTYEIKTPYITESITVPSFNQFIEKIGIKPGYALGGFAILYNEKIIENTEDLNKVFTINLNGKEGNWKLRYSVVSGVPLPTIYEVDFVYLNDEAQKSTEYTITKVINNLLETAECLNETETPRFKLNDTQTVEFEKIKAPDFSLIGTLWECLNQVGGFIHAVPRLENGIIYFDKLGGTQKTDIDLTDYCSSTKRFDIEQFATSLDSSVDNIVNTDNKAQGTIVAPFNDGFKTTRTDTGVVQLTTENCFIETREPIEEIISVECGYLSDGRLVGDITPYIFESAEYNTLSQFDIGYPISRNFALKYTQGQKNIVGLSFKAPNVISPVFAEMSIINIIARKLGINANSIKNEDIMNLQFRVKYIPILSARIKQSKSCIEDLDTVSNLDFNQNANKINSVAYGENMKGTIAKLGNPELTKVYLMNNLNNIAKVGDLFNDDYYISVVKTEFYKDFFKCEIALSKDFNQLNEYVGIDSQKRFYEISEKQAVNRPIIYEDYCVVGNEYSGDSNSLITERGIAEFGQYLLNADAVDGTVDAGEIQGISNTQDDLQKVILPLNTLGIGNSMIFNFHFDDNYSAGNTRIEQSGSKLQFQTKYTNIYGEIDKMNFKLGRGISNAGMNYTNNVKSGNDLPKKTDINYILPYFSTDGKNIVVKKDNRENIAFTYQMNFVTTNKNLIVGSALSRRCSLVTTEKTHHKIYILPNRINKFQNEIDLTNATLVVDSLKGIVSGNTFEVFGFDATTNGKAWAIVNDKNELIVGQNVEIAQNDKITPIYFTFTHKII